MGHPIAINEWFDHIFCINLDRRIDRWEACQVEFAIHDIHGVQRVSAVDGRDLDHRGWDAKYLGEMGCSLSHAKVLERMIEEGWDTVLIFEDDVEFVSDFPAAFAESINSVPDFDMLYLGGIDEEPPVAVSEGVARVTRTMTTSSYAISLPFAKRVLPEIKRLSKPVDELYTDFQEDAECFIFMPHLVVQRPDHSDIEQSRMNYVAKMY